MFDLCNLHTDVYLLFILVHVQESVHRSKLAMSSEYASITAIPYVIVINQLPRFVCSIEA